MQPINYGTLRTQPCPVCGCGSWATVTPRGDGGSIVRCADCAHLYLNPTIPPALLNELYEHEYFEMPDDDAWLRQLDGWVRDPGGPHQKAIEFLDAALPPGALVCEVGCSAGRFLHELERKGYLVKGLEPNRKGVALASSRFGIELHRGFLAEPLPEGFRGAFSAVCAFEVIEHVHEPLAFARACASLLKPGGQLVLSTPNFRLFDSLGSRHSDLNMQEHIQYFTRATLSALLTRAGFETIEARTEGRQALGERLHARFAPAVFRTSLWQSLRGLPLIRAIKTSAIGILGRLRTPLDRAGESGNYIFATARKA